MITKAASDLGAAFLFGGLMKQMLQYINSAVWGIPLILLIVGVGVYISVRTGFLQIRLFPLAVKVFFGSNRQGKTESQRKALSTALAATVGTGNLAGVAGAIAIGGPGAVFWMWICGLIGMATKFAEATLAVYFRKKERGGTFSGGTMYMILKGLPERFHFLAYIYCFFGVVAAFGVGNATQINAAIGAIHSSMNSFGFQADYLSGVLIGLLFAVMVYICLKTGSERIGVLTQWIVPISAAVYILLAAGVLLINISRIMPAIQMILQGAFNPDAVSGGVVASAFVTIKTGASRGVFTNEAGMGTAGIAHANADVEHPVQQGLMGIVEVFIDTILICTLTALVILTSGVGIPYGTDPGIDLTASAFACIYGNWGNVLVALMVCSFAFATVLGWSLYGGRCAIFLFGQRAWKSFFVCQSIVTFITSFLHTETVWVLAEIVNGLMAIPNLIAIGWLSPVLFSLCADYKNRWIRTVRMGNTKVAITPCIFLKKRTKP